MNDLSIALEKEANLVVEKIAAAIQDTVARRTRPHATYRLQFHPEHLRFRDAVRIIPYLSEFGFSHVYASPYFKTRAGSSHGYAIVDYDSLNPELGTSDDFDNMVCAMREWNMEQILDIVPNHMSTAPGENRWWTDVLENGPGSPYAAYFDIDWNPVKEELTNRLLLPILGEQYGNVLESGRLRLEYGGGAFQLRCYDTPLPIDPKTYPQLLAGGLESLKSSLPADSPELLELESVLTALEHLPDRNQTSAEMVRERQRDKELIKRRLAQLALSSPRISEYIAAQVAELNGRAGNPESFDALHRLLDSQVYRLTHWKTASDEINYRRFFDVNDLAAICTEDAAVFDRSHRLVFEMLVHGDVAGLRIDHIDGLLAPTDYLARLQRGFVHALAHKFLDSPAGPESDRNDRAQFEAASSENSKQSDLETAVVEAVFEKKGLRGWPLFVVVEKILGPNEPLPMLWAVAGTTGYDFLRSVNGVFVAWDGLPDMKRVFDRFIGRHSDFHEIAFESKVTILRASMSSELQLLAQRLNRISEQNRRFRDFTLNTLRHALRDIIALFDVYRTYLEPHEVSERDRQFVNRAVAQAKRRNRDLPESEFDFIRDVLLYNDLGSHDSAGVRDRELFVGRFQQVTTLVMAKGVEDTASYRYFPLSSLNEVGDDPSGRPVSADDFHRENESRHRCWPGSLLCTTSHDTKRSEDVRARIDVLSEIPRDWGKAVNRWARLHRRFRREVDGSPAPSRCDEYLLYQTLVGIWPLDEPDHKELDRLVCRLQAYMEKAAREAKVDTSWLNPNSAYEAAVHDFVASVLHDNPKNRFLAEFRRFHDQVVPFGLLNAAAQVLLKLTSPGIPDIYQGQELWNFSLVDPDNRRPVDFELRRKMLSELQQTVAAGNESLLSLARRLARDPRDLLFKLFVTWRALQFRRRNSDLFDGEYLPLQATGERAKHVCAFAWRLTTASAEARTAIVVVPRWLTKLAPLKAESAWDLPFGPAVWADTRIPIDFAPPKLTNVFTGAECRIEGSCLTIASALCDFPLAFLTGIPSEWPEAP